MTGSRRTLPVILRQKDCSWAIWLNQLLSQVLSPRLASTSAVSTRRSSAPRGETASTLRTTTLPPQSQHPKTPMVFHQQTAASGSPQQASSGVVNPWLSADMWSSTRKLVRGNESISSVEATLSRGKRDRDLESVQTLSERRSLHVCPEQRAELAVQEKCAAQKR